MEDRIKDQFPSLFITLVSILVGLVFADLINQAEARMTLWPLNAGTLRTWMQIAAMGANALAFGFTSRISAFRAAVFQP